MTLAKVFRIVLMVALAFQSIYAAHAVAADCVRTGTTCIAGLANDPNYVPGVTAVTPCKTFQGNSVCLSDIGRTCWGDKKTYTCIQPNAVNYCQPFIGMQPACQQTSLTCAQNDTLFGSGCMTQMRTFQCGAPLSPQPTGTIRLADSYTITADTTDKSQCAPLSQNNTCVMAGETCTDPGGTRNINGLDVTKDCWGWTDNYTCLGKLDNSCDDLKAKGCTYQGKACVDTFSPTGQCQTWDDTYLCKIPGSTTTQEDCSNKGFCTGGLCFDTSHPADGDFTTVIAGMEAAREAGTYMGADLQIFKGDSEQCSIKFAGIKNCCSSASGAQSNQSILLGAVLANSKAILSYSFQKASGYMYDFMFASGNDWMTSKAVDAFSSGAWNPIPTANLSFYGVSITYTSGAGFAFAGFDPYSFALQVGLYLLQKLLSCTADEASLKMKKGAHLCHYVGTYCSSKFLGICFEHKEGYCCFNSVLARTVNEQGRTQIGKGWGAPDGADCSGFSTDQFQKLDFSKMDLSEFVNQIIANEQIPDTPTINALAQKQAGSVGSKVQQYYQHGTQKGGTKP